MFAAALIVFRESLEAALFIGIVAAATQQLAGRGRWLGAGVGAGVAGALLLALMAQHISSWFDGLGQDVVNIAVLSVALTMLLWHCIWVAAHSQQMASDARQLGASVRDGQRKPWALLVAVALAVLREGAETVLFIGGSLAGTQASIGEVAASCAIGVLLGVAAGAVIYSGLSRIPTRHIFTATNVLIAVLAGSIASQLAKSLAQAGFIEQGTAPLWDTSGALAPESAFGTLLHALVGYDARPSGVQLVAYLAVLAVIYAGTRVLRPPRATPR
jgi:high-affinity iron transporter